MELAFVDVGVEGEVVLVSGDSVVSGRKPTLTALPASQTRRDQFRVTVAVHERKPGLRTYASLYSI